ncbi:hypothetical protein TCARB_0109 [Thermofilum adornatum 1505]|uniref:Uncharacterized protein n=1 Tax=Thermofilum adornatum 1505 TaxID=697581 RepID=A0A3G1A799_9CREN|nr:hypothetical protein TCARB_0109 [Thermofilum adornatum 1505]
MPETKRRPEAKPSSFVSTDQRMPREYKAIIVPIVIRPILNIHGFVALGEPRSLNAPLKKFHHGLQEAAK